MGDGSNGIKMSVVIKPRVQTEGIMCMDCVMARICVHDSPTERLKDVDLTMDMLELPPIFNWSNLPDGFSSPSREQPNRRPIALLPG